MQLEKGKISSSQITFALICFMGSSISNLLTTLNISRQHSWLGEIIALVIGSFLVWGYIRLALKFPGKTLIQINELIFGPYLGKLISVLYLVYFSLMLLIYLRSIADYVSTFILPKTPMFIILLFLLLVSAQGVSKGIKVITVLGFPIFLLTVIVYWIPYVLIVPEYNLANLLPVFDGTLNDLAQSTHIFISTLFCEPVVFLMIIPFHNNPGETTRAVFIGYFYLGFSSLSTLIELFAVMGNTTLILGSPFLEVVRLVDVANIMTRLEITFSIVVIAMFFIKVSLLYYCTALGIAQLFRLKSYLPLILPLGIIFLCFALSLYAFIPEINYIKCYIWPVATIPVQVVIPVASLLLAKIKKLSIQKAGILQ